MHVSLRRVTALAPILLVAAIAIAIAIAIGGCGSGHGRSNTPGRSGPTTAGPVNDASAAWPALLHGPSHFGAASVTGPQTAAVRWHLSLGGAVVPGVVVTPGDIAYVGTNNGDLRAVDVKTGHVRWTFAGGGSLGAQDLSTSPLVLANGDLIWPGPDHRLFGLTAAGKVRWTVAGHDILTTPVRDAQSDLLIVADQAGDISGYRLGAGFTRPTQVWSRRLASTSFGNPVVAADGTIYQTAGDDLYALSSSGKLKWTFRTPQPVEVSPAVATGGIVVFGSNDRYEYGINSDGSQRWKVRIGDYTYSSPLTLAGRKVIFGNHSGQMTLLNSDTGALVHRDQGSGQLWTAAAVDRDGDAYFASRTGQIFGFTSAGRKLFELSTDSKFSDYPALAPDGTLLIGSDAGTLYAIR